MRHDAKCGNYTSGECGLSCGPSTYVADIDHDDRVVRKIEENLGVTTRSAAIAAQSGGLTGRGMWVKARQK